jgi:hypothetical protein
MKVRRRIARIRPPCDGYAERCISARPSKIVAWWLMAAYLYEHEAKSLLSDGFYDKLCRDLDAKWDVIEHPHKHLIDRVELATSTASYLRRQDYPAITTSAARRLMRGRLCEIRMT